MSEGSQIDSQRDFVLGFAIFSVVAVLLATLIVGDFNSPAEQPQPSANTEQQEAEKGAILPHTQATEASQEQRGYNAPDRWMVKLTFLVVLVSTAQLWMFYGQWRVMRESLGDTKKAAEAALANAQAANTQAKALINSERAYVYFWDMELVEGEGTMQPAYRAAYRNLGRTPAVVIRHHLLLGKFDTPPPRPSATPADIPPGAVIPTNEIWNRGLIKISSADQLATIGGARNIYLYGEIVYRDVFGEERRTWFCRRYNGSQFLLDEMTAHELNGST